MTSLREIELRLGEEAAFAILWRPAPGKCMRARKMAESGRRLKEELKAADAAGG
jgi:hypothetical protein